MIYYQHFVGDYRRDTRHLTLLEHGAYRELLDQYYLTEEPIPLDESKLFRLLSARSDDEKQAIRNVLQDFFVKSENGFIHKRCDIEIETYKAKSESASASAKKRWESKLTDDANAMPMECDGNANHYSVINNQESVINNKKPKKPKALSEQEEKDFNLFWKKYPKKVGKNHAIKAWINVKPDINVVLKNLEWQINSKAWTKNDGEYQPNPSTYLNQGRYLDEPPVEVLF